MSQRGAFILNSVGHKQLTTIVQKYTGGSGANTTTYYVPIANSWESVGAIGTYGWWAGGAGSVVDRVDFANDSPTAATTRGQLPNNATSPTGFGNSYYGWFSGINPTSSSIYRIDFGNDSPVSASTRGPLSSARNTQGGFSNANYGWVGGGFNNPNYLSYLDRINFSNDSPTSSSPRGTLTQNKSAATGTANANYGWFGGGYFPGPTLYSTIERLDFANDTVTPSLRGPLPATTTNSSAASNTNYGYWANGTPSVSVVSRIDFSNDSPTSASLRGFLGYGAQTGAAAGNANFGWFGGGITVSTVSRIDYSNDSPGTASIRGPLSQARGQLGATSNYVKALPGFVGVGSVNTGTFGVFGSPTSINTSTGIAQIGGTYGWEVGGRTPGLSSTVERIDFSNDSPTAAIPRGPHPTTVTESAAVGNNNYGWVGGGSQPATASTVSRIDFSNDLSILSIRGPLSSARYGVSGSGNANYGWFFGGGLASNSIVDRIDFSNDSPASAARRGPLTSGRGYTAAAGNANYGWITAGNPGVSTVERIDYSNDSPTLTSPRGTLTSRFQHAGLSNANYGWFGGGLSSPTILISSIERIDFSNDSPTAASPRNTLSAARTKISGTGNANYGWYNGGSNLVPTFLSTVDRTDFSNDTVAVSVRGPLSIGKTAHSGMSNYVKDRFSIALGDGENYGSLFGGKSYGWLGGGSAGGPTTSSIDCIDFANDSPTASNPRGGLSLARKWTAAASNNNYGWFTGGYTGIVPGTRSTIDRIDFSNDSPTAASPRGLLTAVRYLHAGTGNQNYGWFGGGGPSIASVVYRIDYSNDSPSSTNQRGPLSSARLSLSASSNANYGWFAGGNTSPSFIGEVSTVDRIDFSNDVASANIRGPLPQAVENISSTSNSNYGWWGGGYNGILPAPTVKSSVYRVDFSNDSPTAASPRGPLSVSRLLIGAAGNANYGWFTGGTTPNDFSIVDRIDYSNDSPTAAGVRGLLSSTRQGHAGVSNYVKTSSFIVVGTGTTTLTSGTIAALNINFVATQYNKATAIVGTNPRGNYGWHVAGNPGTNAVVNRIDFSNDSPTAASPRGSLVAGRNSHAGAGNANYGWFGGGNTVPATASSVERIDYSNDAVAASPRGNLSAARYFINAMSNANYGYWIGGKAGPVSTIDRIDFANDSPTSANIRGSMTSGKESTMPVSNASYGWISGNGVSNVERVDFSNDSPTSPSPRGPLSKARGNHAGIGNANYGWIGGSDTTVDRIDYSNDSPTAASLRGSLVAINTSRPAGSGNANYGWWSGGTPSSSVCRLDFANDTANASTRGALAAVKYQHASASNYVK